jgi:hypothetical protein
MEASMFFMGGMTMGYLHPPAKDVSPVRVELTEDKARRQTGPSENPSDSAMERTLIWARRILC